MKSNLLLSSLLSLSFLFTACKKEEVEVNTTDTDTPKEIIVPNTEAITAQNFGGQPTQQTVNVNPNQAAINSQDITQTPQQVIAKAGMNPAHGQPGHRCDIAVGAPLNSPPGKAPGTPGTAKITQQTIPTPTTQNQSTPTFVTSDASGSTAPVATAPGMNPPHGQAGHVCSVAVGAPLPKASETQQ